MLIEIDIKEDRKTVVVSDIYETNTFVWDDEKLPFEDCIEAALDFLKKDLIRKSNLKYK